MSKNKEYTKRVTTDEVPQLGTNQAVKVDYSNLLFNASNYKLIALGLGLIFLGLALMAGGNMEDPNVWDESVIYSFRRITLAPIVILAGLVVEIYAIFYKK